MNRILTAVGVAWTGLVVSAGSALAAFSAIPSQDIDNLVGVSTAGSETGIYEIVANQETLIVAIVTMVMATAAFMLFRTWLRRGRG